MPLIVPCLWKRRNDAALRHVYARSTAPGLLVAAALAACSIAGCASMISVVQWPDPPAIQPDTSLIVPANAAWVDSGIDVVAGQPLTLRAEGSITIGRSAKGRYDDPTSVGPEGTYLYSEKVEKLGCPLPAGGNGPAPFYCLIGRVGDSEPFYIGRNRSWKPATSGRLYFGINDFDVADNEGSFVVNVAKTEAVQPISYQDFVPIDTAPGAPVPGCSVVVFYIDGLRPDVVEEMAAMGHIPNINRLFIEGGVWMSNAFTGFPSDTITSNGTMWTGCFSDRHGLKGQVCFSRRTLESLSYLDPLGPSRSAKLLAPQGLDKFLQESGAASVRMIDGEEAAERFKRQRTSQIPPLYQHLRHNGSDWSTGALPVMTDFPPVPWSRSLTKYVPYLQYQDSWRYMDDANADFAKNFLFERDTPVTIVWLPETDSVSHHDYSRGQFGVTRRTIARADALIGQMVAEIEGRHRLDRTYFILCSDHGHHGGRRTHLSHYDIADEFFHKTRIVSTDGTWVGGGLGLSVRQHRFWNRHPEDRAVDFVYVDADSDGAARIFLPNGHYKSGVWYGKPRPGDLLAYRIADNIPPVNLIASLTDVQAASTNGGPALPVDLVLAKLTDDSILIATHDRGNAVVHRKRNEKDKWIYKYTVVDRLQPMSDGTVTYQEVQNPQTDPLGLIAHLHPRLLAYYHDETQWLRMTALSTYPDSVVALTRHMLWQENVAEIELDHAPDLVVTARPGWFFGILASPGSTHGYPFAESMHASLFVSGPNVRRSARIEEPCRLVDLTPTMLDMIGYQVDTGDFDGHSLRNIFQTDAATQAANASTGQNIQAAVAKPSDIKRAGHAEAEVSEIRAVYWDDFDLHAWEKLDYTARPGYEYLPVQIHHPYSPFDMHNMAYDLLTISDYNVLRIIDEVLSPLSNGRPLVTQSVEWLEARMRRSRLPAVVDAADALDLSTTTLGDYSPTSLGNMKRVDGVVDFVQHRVNLVTNGVARTVGRDQSQSGAVANSLIDRVQWWFWEGCEFGQRVVARFLDERVLNSIEDHAGRAINDLRMQPAEMIVNPAPASTPGTPPPLPPSPQ